MPIPNLNHPVDVVLHQISRGTTFMDEDAREPVQHAARESSVTVPGQTRWVSAMEARPGRSGVAEDERGYVVFRAVDLTAESVTLARGDRISKIGLEDCDVYITRIQPEGHYPDQGGATLFKAYFGDRQPSRQP